MKTNPTTSALRQLLTKIKRNGVPYEDTGHPVSNLPFETDIQDALGFGWIEKTSEGKFKLTQVGENALKGMR